MKMKFSLSVIIAIFILSTGAFCQLADSPWPMFRHDAQHTGRSEYVGPQVPEIKWRVNASGAIISSPVIGADGNIYLGTRIGDVYSLNSDGEVIWINDLFGFGFITSSPAIGIDGSIYFGSDVSWAMVFPKGFYCLNPDGTIKWNYDSLDQIFTSPVIGNDGIIYFGDAGGRILALTPEGSLKWESVSGSNLFSSPAIGHNGVIYFGTANGTFFALNSDDGTLNWKIKIPETQISSSPAVGEDGSVYVGFGDYYTSGGILALSEDGEHLWTYETASVESSPAIGKDGSLYFTSHKKVEGRIHENYFNAINSDGEEIWTLSLGQSIEEIANQSSPTIDANGTIYVGSSAGILYSVEPDGTINWTLEAAEESYIFVNPIIDSDGNLYFGTLWPGQDFYAIGKRDEPIWLGLSLPYSTYSSYRDEIELSLSLQSPSYPISCDVYFLLQNPDEELFFGLDWGSTLAPAASNLFLPAGTYIPDVELLEITIPSDSPPVSEPGTYTFAIGATEPGTLNFISNIEIISFNVE